MGQLYAAHALDEGFAGMSRPIRVEFLGAVYHLMAHATSTMMEADLPAVRPLLGAFNIGVDRGGRSRLPYAPLGSP